MKRFIRRKRMKKRTLLLTAGILLSAGMFAAGCAVDAHGGYVGIFIFVIGKNIRNI